MSDTNIVRLRPYNKRKQHLLRTYMYKGQKFVQGKWYEVPRQMGRYLSSVTMRPGDDEAPLAFDVFNDRVDADGLVRREREAKLRELASIDAPHVVDISTSDLMSDVERERREEEKYEASQAKRAAEEDKEDRKADRASRRAATPPRGGKSPTTATKVASDSKDSGKGGGKGRGRGSKNRKSREDADSSESSGSESSGSDADEDKFFD